MSRNVSAKPSFPTDAFKGTASYYARYRVPYPHALLQDLIRRGGVTGQGRLLDLACGPGRVAFSLAGSFREIWAIDLEPEMIEVGKQEAAQQGINSIQWMVGKAEALTASPAWFELVTIGEAFHRLDQQIVANKTLLWLKPGGCLTVMGNSSLARDWEPWQHIVAQIVHKWTGRAVSTGGVSTAYVPGSGPDHNEQVLREIGFDEVGSYDFVEGHDWTLEAILGNLYSLSVCSKRVLGSHADAFEADLKAALLGHNPSGLYNETMRFGYTLGRKPA
ncbi:MAG TPA: class I SAM-dependent methyltransferase [Chthonomonadaceae bacterium]|nr:class I SAM-dependent methyltransferase [Chthonomonadaceae bacterium]